MIRLRQTLRETAGFTMMELMITVALLTILVAIIATSIDAVKAKARYGQIRADMDAIAQSAYNDYTSNTIWAPLSFASMPPTWAANGEMRRWPTPPCPGWFYSWEDWSVFGYPVTQVTLRRANNTLLWGYCVDTSIGSSCQITDPIFGGSTATEINKVTTHSIYCNE